MSALFAWNEYRKLDAQQKTLIREKEFKSSMSLEKWIPFLGAIAKFDRMSDQLRKACGWATVVSIPVTIILLFVFDGGIFFLLSLAPVALGLAWSRLRKFDIPPALDRFLLPWLVLLKEDVVKGTEVSLKLDFHGPDLAAKQLSPTDMPGGFPDSPHGCKDSYFNDPWLSGSASLADGNVLQWNISDFVRKRVKTRRNARGKNKQKTKYKIQRSFDVNLSARTKDYQANDIQSGADFRSTVKHGEKRTSIRVRSRAVERELAVSPKLTSLVETVSRAYSHLSAPIKKEHP